MIKIAIAEDHNLFRKTMSEALNSEDEFEVVFDVSNGKELLDKLKNEKVDIIILDLDMPVLSGYDAVVKIKRRYPNVRVIILSMHDSPLYVKKLLLRGANAYLNKGVDYEILVDAIKYLKTNEYLLSNPAPKSIKKGSKSTLQRNLKYLEGEILSKREIQVLKLICSQLTAPQIAKKLKLSVRTVENHRQHILKKSGAKNSLGIVEYAIKKGYHEVQL